jgi:hypothetical protein
MTSKLRISSRVVDITMRNESVKNKPQPRRNKRSAYLQYSQNSELYILYNHAPSPSRLDRGRRKNKCIRRESNPSQLLGRQLSYRWTTEASVAIHPISSIAKINKARAQHSTPIPWMQTLIYFIYLFNSRNKTKASSRRDMCLKSNAYKGKS